MQQLTAKLILRPTPTCRVCRFRRWYRSATVAERVRDQAQRLRWLHAVLSQREAQPQHARVGMQGVMVGRQPCSVH